MATPICFKFWRHKALLADSRADDRAGMVRATSTPIIEMTTRSSISVNPKRSLPGPARPVGNHDPRVLSHGIGFYPSTNLRCPGSSNSESSGGGGRFGHFRGLSKFFFSTESGPLSGRLKQIRRGNHLPRGQKVKHSIGVISPPSRYETIDEPRRNTRPRRWPSTKSTGRSSDSSTRAAGLLIRF